ncbi:prepilin peptidase [Novosphingobium decolorationis]|uniref:Prepilin peptidase n=2 Tax=Novosphingobium decolorationis TaxID=2698673 RepID=A0ABX8E2H4_9SPHN|nr:prepilin peptidase [Novosphingobium decolorationis]
MPGGIFSYALMAALATALLVAAVTDIKRREIDNTLNLAIALAAPLWWLATGLGWWDVGFQLALALVTFVVTCALFVVRQMGGGDVKLLTALALWFAPAPFLQLVVLMALLGGAGSVAMAAWNLDRRPGESVRSALALGASALWVGGALAVLIALATGRPLLSSAALQSIRDVLPAGWIIALVVLALLGGFALGFVHLVQRQKARMRVPYGVAIALAGIWVLAQQALASAAVSSTVN